MGCKVFLLVIRDLCNVSSHHSDSFNTFREILDIALERRVDFVLLGGDLFHDNKPSRNAERRCIEILREKVLYWILIMSQLHIRMMLSTRLKRSPMSLQETRVPVCGRRIHAT